MDRLNTGLPPIADPPDLETPQAALESFIDSCQADDYGRAARCLNLNSIPPERQEQAGRELARRLKFVLDQKLWIRWDELPDRPDGADDDPQPKAADVPRGPQRSIRLDTLSDHDRKIQIRLERVRAPGQPAVWVFARRTVDQIDALYRTYGPSPIEQVLPPFLKNHRMGRILLWEWIGLFALATIGLVVGWVVQRGLVVVLQRVGTQWATYGSEAARGPVSVAVGLLVFHLTAARYLRLAVPVVSLLDPVIMALVIEGATWFLVRLIRCATLLVSHRFEGIGSPAANASITRMTVIRHLLVFLVYLAGTSLALSQFDWFRTFGVTLLASAGAMGVILGVAAHRTIGSLFAGLQLALTQPVSTGDAVLYDGMFGWVEEIAFTYIVIRTWDERRLMIPIGHLIDHPIANWSKKSQRLINTVFLYTDYRIDVAAVRTKFAEILDRSEHWDRLVPPVLQVTNCTPDTIELRALCSAGDPGSAWNLQCFVREQLIEYIQGLDEGRYLPRTRVVLDGAPTPAPASGEFGSNGHREAPGRAPKAPASPKG